MKTKRRILTLLLLLLTVPCGLKAQRGPFLVFTAATSKDGVQAFVKEDSAGVRQLHVYVPAGGNIGRDPERIRSEDLTARAFDETGKELGLKAPSLSGDTRPLMGICNAGSCSAIKIYAFTVPMAETNKVRKVVVMFSQETVRPDHGRALAGKSPPSYEAGDFCRFRTNP